MAKKELDWGYLFDIILLYNVHYWKPARLGEARRSSAMMSSEEDT